MSETESNRLKAFRRALSIRSQLLGSIRRHFRELDFLEVETPARLRYPAPEPHIDAIASEDHYLRTSPELHMKRLLAAGYDRIFQLGPCFRRGEHGPRHQPEYTMLEWYRTHADYEDILRDTRGLFARIADDLLEGGELMHRDRRIDLKGPWARYEVAGAYTQWAGWDPVSDYDADRFDLDMADIIEPALAGIDAPAVLMDYPVKAAALARRKGTQPDVAERWELYVGGVELANAYSELTDFEEQIARFIACNEDRKARGLEAYEPDPDYLAALKAGMPPCGGIALGIDRLVMLLAGASTLDEVLPFRA